MIKNYRQFETFYPKNLKERDLIIKDKVYNDVSKIFLDIDNLPINYANLVNDYIIYKFKEKYDYLKIKITDYGHMINFTDMSLENFIFVFEPFLKNSEFGLELEMFLDCEEIKKSPYMKKYIEKDIVKSAEEIWDLFESKILMLHILPFIEKM